ncbi:MAG: PrsW family glutamic-type intramembrane protease [Actinomycetota bacterium]
MGIYIATFLLTALIVPILGNLYYHLADKDGRFIAIAIIMLPFSPIINLVVKKPILNYLLASWDLPKSPKGWPLWFGLVSLLLVGITEELIKISPLISGRIRALITSRRHSFVLACLLGFGFSIGETWYLAWSIYQNDPKTAALPFYLLGGFTSERSIAVFAHTVFLIPPVLGLLRSFRHFVLGIVASVYLHALFDIPAMLYKIKIVSSSVASVLFTLDALAILLIYGYFFSRTIDKNIGHRNSNNATIDKNIGHRNSNNATILYERQPDK